MYILYTFKDVHCVCTAYTQNWQINLILSRICFNSIFHMDVHCPSWHCRLCPLHDHFIFLSNPSSSPLSGKKILTFSMFGIMYYYKHRIKRRGAMVQFLSPALLICNELWIGRINLIWIAMNNYCRKHVTFCKYDKCNFNSQSYKESSSY